MDRRFTVVMIFLFKAHMLGVLCKNESLLFSVR